VIFVFSATAFGSGFFSAPAMYADTSRIRGETSDFALAFTSVPIQVGSGIGEWRLPGSPVSSPGCSGIVATE
jgi:hypothetical protein